MIYVQVQNYGILLCELKSTAEMQKLKTSNAYRRFATGLLPPRTRAGSYLPPSRMDQHVAIGIAAERSVTTRSRDSHR